MANVLIVDDDVELCELVTEYLTREGYAVECVYDGSRALERLAVSTPDLVVLDVMLPGLNGFEVLRQIRDLCEVPVIMLTARGEEVDRVVGLELGADDYMPKPFSPRELTARMRAVLRRVEHAAQHRESGRAEALVVGDLRLDLGARTVTVNDAELRLTGVEFGLLERIVRDAGTVVDRGDLSRDVLGRRASTFDRSLDVHISNLRKKLGPLADGGDRIKTVRGVGYIYVRPAD